MSETQSNKDENESPKPTEDKPEVDKPDRHIFCLKSKAQTSKDRFS